MKYVYRRRNDGIYEVGITNLDIDGMCRTNIPDWCDDRVCETWSEKQAIEIVKALESYKD